MTALFTDFAPAPWDTGNAGKVMDAEHLANITQVNIYLGHGSDGSTTDTIYLDDIRAE